MTILTAGKILSKIKLQINIKFFYVLLTVHRRIDLFHLPTLMHNSFIL